jgi:hypothetical protein
MADAVPALRPVLVVGALLSAGALFFGVRAGYSTAAGVAIAAADLYVLARMVGGLVGATSSQAGVRLAPVVLIKFLLLVTVILLVLSRKVLAPLPLLVGLGALPLGVVASVFRREIPRALL